MADKDLNEKNIEQACRDEITRRLLNQIITKVVVQPDVHAKQMRPHMRPHTWVFLRQRDNRKEPAICLGIVFHTWDRAKYNMIRFTAYTTVTHKPVATSGLLTTLDNGETGIIIDVRWPWTTLLKEFKGLSAGNL